MKNYFNFQLTGKQLWLLWLIFYVLFLAPYFVLIFKIQSLKPDNGVVPAFSAVYLLLLLALVLFAMIWTVYFVKMILQGISLNEISLKCDYSIGKYLGIVFLGMLLTIITLGIYSPWFVRNLQRFYINNSSYNDNKFSFQGEGGKLFVIILLTVIVPMIIVGISMYLLFGKDISTQTKSYQIINQVVMNLLLIPYMYFIYKWVVDIRYKEYHIKWETEALPSIGKIAVEVILSIITFGIYFPLAFVRLYKYFTEKTKGKALDNQTITFGYDIDQLNDFLLIWGQILLTIVTLGIYYPWAICKISKRILSKTYMEKISN